MSELKDLWQRLKIVAKRDVSNNKKELKKTGGGTNEAKISDVSAAVAECIPGQLHSLMYDLDCDATSSDEELPAKLASQEDKPKHAVSLKEPTLSSNERKPTSSKSNVENVLLQFAKEEHLKKMELLDLKIEYRKRKLASMDTNSAGLRANNSLQGFNYAQQPCTYGSFSDYLHN